MQGPIETDAWVIRIPRYKLGLRFGGAHTGFATGFHDICRRFFLVIEQINARRTHYLERVLRIETDTTTRDFGVKFDWNRCKINLDFPI